MSVIMLGEAGAGAGAEGGVAGGEGAPAFSGKWYFAKEKQNNLQFRYQRVSDSVPRDLLDFVSFIHPGVPPGVPPAFANNKKKSKKSKSRSGGSSSRNRLAASVGVVAASAEAAAAAAAVTSSEVAIVQTESVDTAEMLDDARSVDTDEHIGDVFEATMEQVNLPEQVASTESAVLADAAAAATTTTATTTTTAAAAATAATAAAISTATAVEQRPTHPVLLKSDHPFFGLWEGSFDIITAAPNAESTVAETFFFYSYMGVDCGNPELIDLPQEAHFTSAVLKVAPVPLLPGQQKTIIPVGSAEAVPQGGDASTEATAAVVATTTAASAEGALPVVLVGDSQLVILVGFGRNKFGRFSLAASYDPSKGTLICEKRYMLSKSASSTKRGKRQDGEQAIDRSSLARARSGSYLDFEGYEQLTPGGKRKRPSSSKAGGDEGGFGGGENFGSRRKSSEGPIDYVPIPNEGDDDDYRAAFYDEGSGEVYEGGWYNGKRHGRGICMYVDGTMFEGNWSLGKEQGHGQLLSGDRHVIYMGEWFDGLMHGHGTYNFGNGDKYTGEWREGNRHGKGELFVNGGCKYVGEWKENKRSGRGVYTWPDGSYYDGDWELDKRHGKGILVLATSNFFYDGLWAGNHPDGRGNCVFASGMEYQGSFKAGLREGRGTLKFPQGAEYEGRFRDDRIDGQGTLKITQSVPGHEEGEQFIPIDIQADLKRIHLKAGFGFDEPRH